MTLSKPLSALLLTAFFTLSSFARHSGGAVPFTNITTDARSAGLGTGGVAISGDAYSVFRNAAQTTFADTYSGMAYSYAPWLNHPISGSFLHTAAGFCRFGERHGVSAGFRS